MEDDFVLPKAAQGMNSDTVPPGLHLLIDFWGCRNMQDVAGIERAMRQAAADCGATVLDVQLHSFGVDAGVTGVATLAESHISIHTWPEIDYVALDVFVCGACDAHRALDALTEFFRPLRQNVVAHQRGLMPALQGKAIA